MRHAGDIELTWGEVCDALAALEGSLVTVRIVERGEPEMLLAVVAGHLGAMTRSKHPALIVLVGQGQVLINVRRAVHAPRS
jgi:hypothetical protein